MSDWMSTYLKAAGLPNSSKNRNFLATWQRFEGGHTNNSARFNYLNTTQTMPGSTSMNSVGVQRYRSLGEGARAWAKTLRNGRYEDLYQGMRAGDPYSSNVVRGLSTWLSGSPDSASGHAYAQRVLGTKVSAPAPSPSAGGAPNRTGAPPALRTSLTPAKLPSFGFKQFEKIAMGGDPVDIFTKYMKQLTTARSKPPTLKVLPGLPNADQPSQPGAQPASSRGFGVPVELFYDPIGGIKFGKQIGAIGGHSDHVHYSAGNASEMMKAIRLARTMGLSVRENPAAGDKVDPVHVTNSYHYRRYPKHPNVGEAIDVSGSAAKMAAFYRRLARGQ